MRTLLSATIAASALSLSLAMSALPGALSTARASDEPPSTPLLETGFVPELSTQKSSTYREDDGSYRMEAFTEPVNYINGSGALKPIDTTLVDATGAVYDVQTAANSVTVKIPEDASTDPVKVADGSVWVTIRLHGTGDEPATIEGSTATFSDVEGADAVAYEAIATGVKESVTLSARPGDAPSFTYDVDAAPGLRPVAQPDGSIWFLDANDRMQMTIPAAFMVDSAMEVPARSEDVPMTIHSTGDHWTLTATPSYVWLMSPDRVYPVVIDPTVVNKNTNFDCWISQADPNNGICGSGSDHLRVGVAVSDNLKRRGLLSFDVSSIPAEAQVISATTNLYLDSSYSSNHQAADYGLHAPSKVWNNSATWNTSGPNGTWTGGSPGGTAYSSKNLSGSTDGYKAFTGLQGLVQGWINQSIPNRGIVLKQEAESTANVIGFFSAAGPSGKKPYLAVNFTVPPSSPDISVSPCVGNCDPQYTYTDTLTPVLTAVSTADPEDATLSYAWEIRPNGSPIVIASDFTSATQSQMSSWTVPPGTLSDESVYQWRVTASDGVANSATGWTMLGVDVNQAPYPPTNLGLSPCSADDCGSLVSSSTTPTLTATASDPEDFWIEARFEVRLSSGGTIIASGTDDSVEGAQSQFSVPYGTLANGDQFEFRVGGDDGNSVSWSAWVSASVELPPGPPAPADLKLASCAEPCAGWASSTTTPTFEATRPAGSGSGSIIFEVRSANGFSVSHTAANVGPGEVADWTIEPSTLGPGTFELRAGTADNVNATNWTSWTPFAIDADAIGADFPASDATTPELTGPYYDANATPDPALDADDTGAQGQYSDADLDMLDDQIALDEAYAASLGLSANDPELSHRRVSIPLKYAPKAWVNSAESQFPISPMMFINHSDLWWHSPSCGNYTMTTTPNSYSLGHLYVHQAVSSVSCETFGGDYHSYEDVRPGDEFNDVPQKQGMVLNLNNSYKNGKGFKNKEPVFYEYLRNNYLVYWFPWGNSFERKYIKVDGVWTWVDVGTHEGDWEHVAIQLDSNNEPVTVKYYYHYDFCTLDWDKAPKRRTHLKLWIARFAHGNYPAGAKAPMYQPGSYRDPIDGDGEDVWFASSNLKNVENQDWYTFGGSWGNTYGLVGAQWGPMGPNWLHQYMPPTFGGAECVADPSVGGDW